jgi:hypothetical protein
MNWSIDDVSLRAAIINGQKIILTDGAGWLYQVVPYISKDGNKEENAEEVASI